MTDRDFGIIVFVATGFVSRIPISHRAAANAYAAYQAGSKQSNFRALRAKLHATS